MAYNLQPLIQILERILNPQDHRRLNWSLDPCKKPDIESLLAKVHFLNDFFENPSSVPAHVVGRLENRIRDAACHAQDIIESHLADQILSKKDGENITISPPDLLKVIEEYQFQRILEEMVEIMDGSGTAFSNLVSTRHHLSATQQDLNPKNIAVGISKDMIQLKEQLIMPQEPKLEIIPIVGMGGIGKTTLSRTLYEDESVVSYFDTRAWVVISQSYCERDLLSGLLQCITGNLLGETFHQDGYADLGLQLYKKLWGRRYLIVLDDMWSSEAWDCIRMFFPDENNGSRIMVTTREENVANCVASAKNLHHQMKLLNEVESWELLHRKVFPEGSCAPELEKFGKTIAKNCKGLPLAIHVIGGVLSLLPKTQEAWTSREAWMQVAEDINSFVANKHELITNILSLSYNHLPNYLKPCFLYMGAFPEDCEITTSRLIRLWMAEGFIKPIFGMSFEDTAREYLRELVQRNLLSVGQQGTNKSKAKSYIMHDLLRDLCIRKAREEKFFYVGSDIIKDLNPKDRLQLRLSIHALCNQFPRIMESSDMPSVVRSLVIFPKDGIHDLPWIDNAFRLRLLKVLDMLAIYRVVFPKEMERLVNLRYLAANISSSRSRSTSVAFPISNLCNLQTLILGVHGGLFDGRVKEVFDMPQLRHIKLMGYPLFRLEDWESVAVHEQLQTLSMVAIDDSFPRILKFIPNLKKLGIHWREDTPLSSNIDLGFLTQLQSLKCFSLPWLGRSPHLEFIIPPSLKKLTLYICDIPIRFLNEIGGLPNLEVFKILHSGLADDMWEWEPIEGEFQQLRFLQLDLFQVKRWIADETHYPRLEHLVIQDGVFLEEIPSEIGYIPTLKIIEVKGEISASGLESARKIQA